MKKLLTLFLLLTCGICNGQNLVSNGDFEQYWHCPSNSSQIDSAKFWFQPSLGTPDYYNQCATFASYVDVPNNLIGFQQAHSGVAYAGIYTWTTGTSIYREYIEVPFSSVEGSSLIANECYHFEMYINLGNKCEYNTYDIGAYFSDTIVTGISNVSNFPFIPQISNAVGNFPDTLNWTLVSGNYTAVGGESYLIIGNFKNNVSTDTSTFNHLSTYNWSYIYIDDVSLTPCASNGITNYKNEIQVNLFPNPLTDKLNIQINNYEPTEIILYDLSSRKLLQQTFTNSTTINTELLANGMYLYTVRNRNGIIKNGKVIKQ